MKVAVLIDTWFPFVGGGQINAFEISKRISEKGIKIEIITRNNGKEKLKYPKNLSVIKLGNYTRPDNNLSKIKFIFDSFFYVRSNGFDLVHAHAFLPGIAAKLLMMFQELPAVFTVHGTSLGTNLNTLLIRFIEKIILTKLKYTKEITVSRDFLKLENVNKKIEYIPNGVDPIFFKAIKTIKKQQIICVARLHPQKNLINLIMAFKAFLKKHSDYELIIVGDGPSKKIIEDLIITVGLRNKVVLIKNASKNELRKLYSESTLFVLPSLYEGQPLTLLEAIACGLPIVATKTGDIPFLIKDNLNGYLIKGNPSSKNIFTAMVNALDGKNILQVGQKGANIFKNKYSWELSSLMVFNIYKSLRIK